MIDFRYSVSRSVRKTISITVRGGKIFVRAPFGASDALIDSIVRDKANWLIDKMREQCRSEDLFLSVRQGKTLLDCGVEKPVRFGMNRNAEKDGEFWFLDATKVRRYFEKTRGWRLVEKTALFARKICVCPQDVILSDFKARWGSCDALGKIKLNWRLLMLPESLCDYVLIHELCHLKELNHSAEFWRIVGIFCPNYKQLRARLKEYSFLTELYRRDAFSTK